MTTPDKQDRTSASLEENLKKALTELLILHLLHQREYYIGELTADIEKRSLGALSIVFPYGVIYRMTKAAYITESKKRTAPDGRLRQYYRITDAGKAYLNGLMETYQRFTAGVADILKEADSNE